MEQQHVPEAVLGRVDSVAWTGSILFMPAAYAIAGPVAGWIGVRETLLGAAAIGTACTVGALLSRSVRDLRRLEEEDVTPSVSRGEVDPAPLPTLSIP